MIPPVCFIVSTYMPAGNPGVPYSNFISASGGKAPYTWCVLETSGSMSFVTDDTNLNAGTYAVNGANYFAADTPFGGYKQSGIGREMGREGFEEYLETKSVAVPA